MAKVTIVLDTEENTLVADIDGKEISNLDYVSVYKYDEGAISFSMSEKVKKDGMMCQSTNYSWCTPRYGCCAQQIKIETNKGDLQKSIANLLKK